MKEKVSKQKQREQLGIGLKVRNSGWLEQEIQELSKGMAQKIQFVVCVLHKP
jgi:ABC-2 type transport system ATP-binding protein